jgi:endonuclease/exonuclease/phosphatase family metal-dependent hydrolase
MRRPRAALLGVLVAVSLIALSLVVASQSPNRPGALAVATPNNVVRPLSLSINPLGSTEPTATKTADGGDSVTFSNLDPARYELTIRSADPQRDPSSLECTPTSAAGPIDLPSGVAVLSIASNQTVTCTVNTAERGRIVTTGKTLPAGSNMTMDLDPSWGASFSLSHGESRSSQPLTAGTTYSIQPTVPRGWVLSSSRCDDGSDPRKIELDAGETVECTVTMAKGGRIVLRHQTLPASVDRTFTYDPSWGARIALAHGQSRSSPALPRGVYSVAASVPAAWSQASVTCDDGSGPRKIELATGETVTCTFTTAKKGRILVRQQTEPASSGSAFAFTPSWGDAFELSNGESKNSRRLAPRTYSVEAAAPEGWALSPNTCDDGSDPSAIELDPGEQVTCTFVGGERTFTTATFNVLGNSHTQKGGHAHGLASGVQRMGRTVDLLQSYGVDVVGFQELQIKQYSEFLRLAGDEFGIYPGPEQNRRSKQNSIAWRTSVFDLVEGRPLMIPYFDGQNWAMPLVRLRHKATGQEFYMMTVHNAATMKRTGNQTRWREAAMRKEIRIAHELSSTGLPVIVTGDMNDRVTYFCNFTASGEMHAAAGGGNSGSCQPPPASIARVDWIFGSRDVSFSDYRFIKDAEVLKVSDHPLILTETVLG